MVSAAYLLPLLQPAKYFDQIPTCRPPFTSLRFCYLGTRLGEVQKGVVSKSSGLKKISVTRKLKLNRGLNGKTFLKGSLNCTLFPIVC